MTSADLLTQSVILRFSVGVSSSSVCSVLEQVELDVLSPKC